MSIKLDIRTDFATSRLVSVAQAVQLTGVLPAESAKTLVANAKAVRLFVLANEIKAAEAVLEDVDVFTESADQESLHVMVKRHTDAVRKAINPPAPPAIRSAVARVS